MMERQIILGDGSKVDMKGDDSYTIQDNGVLVHRAFIDNGPDKLRDEVVTKYSPTAWRVVIETSTHLAR
jgi:hypothetical protein